MTLPPPLVTLNLVACALIFWSCATFLLARGQAKCWRQLGTQVGLVLCMVGAMVSGIAPLRFGIGPDWWSLTLRGGIAIVATTQYDKTFGIARQWRHAFDVFTGAPARLRAWWSASWEQAQEHQRAKRR